MTTRASRRKLAVVGEAPRILSRAEAVGIQAAYQGVQNSQRQLQQANQQYLQVMASVGLDPSKNWSIKDDLSVVEVEAPVVN